MSTSTEKSSEKYIFKFKNEPFSNVIAYMSNTVKAIKENEHSIGKEEIQAFRSNGITHEKFIEFVRVAENYGYLIYRVEKQ